MKKTEIRKRIYEAFKGWGDDDMIQIKRNGTVVAKRSYFYRHGMTAEKWLEWVLGKLEHLGFTIGLTECNDNWNAWPKDSWFEARVEIKELNE